MERTNTHLSAIVAHAAALLAEHVDAPTLCHVRVGVDAVFPSVAGMPLEFRPQITGQLDSHGTFRQLRDIAHWAQRLNTELDVAACGDALNLAATTEVGGVLVEVWTSIAPGELAHALPPTLAERCANGARLPVAELLAALA
jgi:hypothetical protein